MAEWTGLEPATTGVTGRYSNQLNYHSVPVPPRPPRPWWVLRDSNPRHPPCKGGALPAELSTRHAGAQFRASFSALAALNDGLLEAAILMLSPVAGLRPVRAGRCFD